MKIALVVIGKTNKSYVSDGLKVFKNRINRYLPFDIIDIPDVKNAKNKSPEQIKEEEREKILKLLKPDDYIILLDEKGADYHSKAFAKKIQDLSLRGIKRVIFVVGGAFGFSPQLKGQVNEKISLSKMTFSHQLIRLIFAEQLYRAFTIINNEPYHNE